MRHRARHDADLAAFQVLRPLDAVLRTATPEYRGVVQNEEQMIRDLLAKLGGGEATSKPDVP